MLMIIGLLSGAFVRLLTAFLGGNRVESLVTACLIMAGWGPEFSIGFLSTFIGLKGLSLPMDILQPVNIKSNPFLAGYIERQLFIGEAPALIRGIYSMEIFISWIIYIPGLFLASYLWQDGMKTEFSGIVMSLSPYIISLIWLLQLIKSERKVRYIIGMVVVGAFGLFITGSGVGQFGMMIALSLLFMGWEGLSTDKIPEQNWKYLHSREDGFGTYTLLIGAISAIFIGCPSSPMVELYEDELMSVSQKFWAHLVASKVSEAISLLLWFYYGAARGATSDVLDKTVEGGLVGNSSMVIGFLFILAGCNYLCWNYLDLFGKLNWVWSNFLCPNKALNMVVSLVMVVFYIPLGVPVVMVPILVFLSLCVREVMDRMKLPPTISVSMVSIVPLVGIWLN